MNQDNLAKLVEEITSSLKNLPELNLDERPTITDYADALPAVLFYAGITGKANNLSEFGELIGLTSSHISKAIHRKFPEPVSFKGKKNPYVSIYESAMQALELPESIDPRILTRSYHALAESMIKIIHGTARIEIDREYVRTLDKYKDIQTPGVKKTGIFGIYRGLVEKIQKLK